MVSYSPTPGPQPLAPGLSLQPQAVPPGPPTNWRRAGSVTREMLAAGAVTRESVASPAGLQYEFETWDDFTSLAPEEGDDQALVNVLGGDTAGDGRGGRFRIVFAGGLTADDGVVVDLDGGAQAVRLFEGSVRPEWWGVLGDGVTDDTDALQDCFDAAASIAQGVYVRDGLTILTSDTVSFTGRALTFDGDAQILYDGTMDRVALSLGAASDTSLDSCRFRLAVEAATRDWSDDACIGIDLRNVRQSNVEIVLAKSFHTGVRCIGDGTGFVYNNVSLGTLLNNSVGVKLTNVTGSGTGWCNENVFIGGRFSVSSSTETDSDRYGVVITSEDATYENNNNNVFLKPSFELSAAGTDGGVDAYPVLVEYGLRNTFRDVRIEDATKSGAVLTVQNSSASNLVTAGYSGSNGTEYVDNQSDAGNNRLEIFNRVAALTVQKCEVSDIFRLATPYDATDTLIQGHFVQSSSSSTRLQHFTSITPTDPYIEVGGTRGIGVSLHVSGATRVLVNRDCETGYPGRIHIACFDSSSTRITSPSSIAVSPSSSATYNGSSFGGTWRTGSDSTSPALFELPSGTEFIDVIFVGGSATCRLRSYCIQVGYPFEANTVRMRKVPRFGQRHEEVRLATQAPASGTWAVGDTIYDVAPTASGTMGWVCVAAGTPGTWKAFGAIAS